MFLSTNYLFLGLLPFNINQWIAQSRVFLSIGVQVCYRVAILKDTELHT